MSFQAKAFQSQACKKTFYHPADYLEATALSIPICSEQ